MGVKLKGGNFHTEKITFVKTVFIGYFYITYILIYFCCGNFAVPQREIEFTTNIITLRHLLNPYMGNIYATAQNFKERMVRNKMK